jgi:hypothetical protein
MLRRTTCHLVLLLLASSCSRGHTYKTYAYVSDFPAGHVVIQHDLSVTAIETDGTEDVIPQIRGGVLCDVITEEQLRGVLGKSLVHGVGRGAKLSLSDFNAQ